MIFGATKASPSSSCSFACAWVMIPTHPRLDQNPLGNLRLVYPWPSRLLPPVEAWVPRLRGWWPQNPAFSTGSGSSLGTQVLSSDIVGRSAFGKERKQTLVFLLLPIWNILKDTLRVRTDTGLSWTCFHFLLPWFSRAKPRRCGERAPSKTDRW